MMAFIASPLVVLVILVYAILFAFERGPSMVAEPVGAGAGTTGGANAIGQSIFGDGTAESRVPAERTARGVELLVLDRTGLASPDRPIVLLTNHTGFDAGHALPLTLADGGLWTLRLPEPQSARQQGERLAFRFGLLLSDGVVLPERGEDGEIIGARRLPRVTEREAIADTPLRYEFVVRVFGDVPPDTDPGGPPPG